MCLMFFFFFSSRRRHTRFDCDWSSDVCSSDLEPASLWSRLEPLPDFHPVPSQLPASLTPSIRVRRSAVLQREMAILLCHKRQELAEYRYVAPERKNAALARPLQLVLHSPSAWGHLQPKEIALRDVASQLPQPR